MKNDGDREPRRERRRGGRRGRRSALFDRFGDFLFPVFAWCCTSSRPYLEGGACIRDGPSEAALKKEPTSQKMAITAARARVALLLALAPLASALCTGPASCGIIAIAFMTFLFSVAQISFLITASIFLGISCCYNGKNNRASSLLAPDFFALLTPRVDRNRAPQSCAVGCAGACWFIWASGLLWS